MRAKKPVSNKRKSKIMKINLLFTRVLNLQKCTTALVSMQIAMLKESKCCYNKVLSCAINSISKFEESYFTR